MTESVPLASHEALPSAQNVQAPARSGTPINDDSAPPDPPSQVDDASQPLFPPPTYTRGSGNALERPAPAYEFDVEEARAAAPPPSYSEATKGASATRGGKAKKQWRICGFTVTLPGLITALVVLLTAAVIVGGILGYRFRRNSSSSGSGDGTAGSDFADSDNDASSNFTFDNDPRLGPFPLLRPVSFNLVANTLGSNASLCNSYASLWSCPYSKTLSWNLTYYPSAFNLDLSLLAAQTNSSLNLFYDPHPPADYTPYITLARNVRQVGLGILLSDPSAEVLGPYLLSSSSPDVFTNQPVPLDVTGNYTASVQVSRNVTVSPPDLPQDMAIVFAGTWNCLYTNVTLAAKFTSGRNGRIRITELSETTQDAGECSPAGPQEVNVTQIWEWEMRVEGDSCACTWTDFDVELD